MKKYTLFLFIVLFISCSEKPSLIDQLKVFLKEECGEEHADEYLYSNLTQVGSLDLEDVIENLSIDIFYWRGVYKTKQQEASDTEEIEKYRSKRRLLERLNSDLEGVKDELQSSYKEEILAFYEVDVNWINEEGEEDTTSFNFVVCAKTQKIIGFYFADLYRAYHHGYIPELMDIQERFEKIIKE